MIRIANAPCSWGALEFGPDKGTGYARVLDEMAQAGYDGTELGDWGFMPAEPGRLRDELARRRLDMVGAFVPVALWDERAHEAGVEAAVRTARLLAAVAERAFIVLSDDNGKSEQRTKLAGRIGPEQAMTNHQWTVFGRGAERVAEAVRDAAGLRTVFHHHCAGYIETASEVEALLAVTSGELVGLCLDTGHFAFGGGNPLEALDQFAGRIWHVHFKDLNPAAAEMSRAHGWDYFESVRNGVFCELGKGMVPFEEIAATLVGRDYDGWVVVEQDVLPGMGTPFQSAMRNRAFLRGLGL